MIQACEGSLRRLGTDYIDIYHLHGFDALTPQEEVLSTLDRLVTSGKVRYIACSNFSGWHLMKSLDVSDRYGWTRYVGHQVYYSLIGREYEWELMPLGLDQRGRRAGLESAGMGTVDGQDPARASTAEGEPTAQDRGHWAHKSLRSISTRSSTRSTRSRRRPGKTVPQIALNWLLQRPTVSTVIFGARNEEQLRQNLGSAGWNLTAEQVGKLDRASDVTPVYPYWHQRQFTERNPLPVAPIAP